MAPSGNRPNGTGWSKRSGARLVGDDRIGDAESTRDTDTLARIEDDRFAILAVQAGCSASSIVGRLRLHLELGRISHAEVAVGDTGRLLAAWQGREAPTRPTLRLVG